MMYMHYCQRCHRIHMLNGHKMSCPKCSTQLAELRLPYMSYVNMDIDEREAYKALCADSQKLKAITTTYRMYKYSKWYKESLALEQRKKEQEQETSQDKKQIEPKDSIKSDDKDQHNELTNE